MFYQVETPLKWHRRRACLIWARLNRTRKVGVTVESETVSSPLAYARVLSDLRRMVVAWPFEAGAIPPEPELVALYGVSRGTLRRATEELSREQLLSAERGRGTFVVREQQVRLQMVEAMQNFGRPDSRWDDDFTRFVPDFAGSNAAAEAMAATPVFRAASVVFAAPDNSLTGLIVEALAQGKSVLVPTYALRRGIVLLDADRVSPRDRMFASTLDGLERFGHRLTLAQLSKQRVELVVTGAIAIGADGHVFGQLEAYLEIELALLERLGVIDSSVPRWALVHDAQMLDVDTLGAPSVDLAVTPTRTISFVRRAPDVTFDILRLAAASNPKLDYLSVLYHHEERGQ